MRRQADGRDNDEQDGEMLKVGLREREREKERERENKLFIFTI